MTGATSFLGRRFLAYLSKQKVDVFATASGENKNLKIQKMNFLFPEEVKETISRARSSVIYHIGGLVNLSRDYEVYKNCLEINTIGTLNLLESLRDYPPKKFVFISTEEIYGNSNIPYTEESKVDPPSGYSISKLAAERLCMIYAKEFKFQLIIARIGTMYGPGDRIHRLIPQIIVRAINNKQIDLNSGLKKRDYVFIDDVVEALIRIKEATFNNGVNIINISGGRSYSLRKIVDLILSFAKSKSKVFYGQIPERLGEADEWLLDIHKASKLLNWQPKTTIGEGLRQTVDYFKKR